MKPIRPLFCLFVAAVALLFGLTPSAPAAVTVNGGMAYAYGGGILVFHSKTSGLGGGEPSFSTGWINNLQAEVQAAALPPATKSAMREVINLASSAMTDLSPLLYNDVFFSSNDGTAMLQVFANQENDYYSEQAVMQQTWFVEFIVSAVAPPTPPAAPMLAVNVVGPTRLPVQ